MCYGGDGSDDDDEDTEEEEEDAKKKKKNNNNNNARPSRKKAKATRTSGRKRASAPSPVRGARSKEENKSKKPKIDDDEDEDDVEEDNGGDDDDEQHSESWQRPCKGLVFGQIINHVQRAIPWSQDRGKYALTYTQMAADAEKTKTRGPIYHVKKIVGERWISTDDAGKMQYAVVCYGFADYAPEWTDKTLLESGSAAVSYRNVQDAFKQWIDVDESKKISVL